MAAGGPCFTLPCGRSANCVSVTMRDRLSLMTAHLLSIKYAVSERTSPLGWHDSSPAILMPPRAQATSEPSCPQGRDRWSRRFPQACVPCADLRCLLMLLGCRRSQAWLGRTKNVVDYLSMALFNFGMLTQSPASIAFRKRLLQWPGSSSMWPVSTSL